MFDDILELIVDIACFTIGCVLYLLYFLYILAWIVLPFVAVYALWEYIT